MTNKSDDAPHLLFWREVLGEDAEQLWRALEVDESPNAYVQLAAPKHSAVLFKIAALVACLGIVVLLQWQTLQKVQALHTENMQLKLQSQDVMLQLDVLAQLQILPPATIRSLAPELIRVLSTPQDPNVQLSALEALVRLQVIRSAADLPVLAPEQRQEQFLLTAYHQLYGE